MTLDCKLIWVDDTPDWVDSITNLIEPDLVALGINLDATKLEDGNNLIEALKNERVDLIFMDYSLPDVTGDELIKSIRNHGDITQILFYSMDDLHENEVSNWPGVNYTRRNEARDDIVNLLKNFAERYQNIALTRGIIIAEAIDLENILSEVIKKFFDNKAILLQEKVFNKAWIDFGKKVMLLISLMNDVLEDLKTNITPDEEKIREVSDKITILKAMEKDVVDQRNILAHSEKCIDENGQLILKGLNKRTEKIVFDNTWKNLVRGNIKKHKANLRQIIKLVG